VNDTSPDIEKMVCERLMALSGAERFGIGSEMFDAARRRVLASSPAELPVAEPGGLESDGSDPGPDSGPSDASDA
jgi:hypothetical protein